MSEDWAKERKGYAYYKNKCIVKGYYASDFSVQCGEAFVVFLLEIKGIYAEQPLKKQLIKIDDNR